MRKLPALRPAPAACAAALVAGLSFFGIFAADLLLHGPITHTDPAIGDWFQGHLTPELTRVLFAITYLHSTTGICLIAAVVAVALFFTSNRSWLPALAVCVPGGLLLNAAVKHLFDRARPSVAHPLVTLGSSSFPSGHAAGATVCWGFLLVVWWTWQPGTTHRLAGIVLAAAMVALTAVSRVYLGAHYASDVLAAIGEGTAWLAFGLLVTSRRGGGSRSG